MPRFFKKIIVAVLLAALIVGGFILWASPRYVTPVLMYHHVRPGTASSDRETVSPEDFEKHLAYIARHGFHVLSLEELVGIIEQNKPFPRRSVVLTFDDGYEDNYQFAYPLLKKYGFPAAIFIISDFVGNNGFMTWEQVKALAADNITIGSHTRRHRYLPELTPEEQADEVQGSKEALENALGRRVEFFSYPVGGFNEVNLQEVRQAGYRAALSTNRGRDKRNRDIWEINRISMRPDNAKDIVLMGKLSGYYNLFRKSKDPY